MRQNAQSGAEANQWGRRTARSIARRIDAVPVADGRSNEFARDGRLITIRCARRDTTSVGVSYKMLDRVDAVIAAFETNDGAFELYEMSPSLYKLFLRDSKGKNQVGLVSKTYFVRFDRNFQTIHL